MNSLITYQGGKQKYAKRIISHISPEGKFIDCCSGSGAITLELLAQGYNPADITMIDAGCMAKVFKKLVEGELDIGKMKELVLPVKQDIKTCHQYLKQLTEEPFSEELYLILQAGSFGGKQVHYVDGWKHAGFRSHWLPTATSSRKSPVNPMMPMPDTLILRAEMLQQQLQGSGLTVLDVDLNEFDIRVLDASSVLYIDPPYKNTTAYHNSFAYDHVVAEAVDHFDEVWVSEYFPLSNTYFTFGQSGKGGVSGSSNKKKIEHLSKLK